MPVNRRFVEHCRELGYYMVPIGDDKLPKVKWKNGVDLATVIEMVERRRAEIAFLTGASRIVVADCDSEEAVEWAEKTLPPTPQTAITTRGKHFYYRTPQEIIPIRHGFNGMACDILSLNSYVIRKDTLTTILRPSELPEFPAELVMDNKSKVMSSKIIVKPVLDPDRERLIRRAELYIAKIEREEGRRDFALFKAACALIQKFGLTEDEAYPLLVGFNLTIQPPFPDARVRYKLSEALRLKGGRRE